MATEHLPLIAHVIVKLDIGGLENGLVNVVNRIPRERYRQSIVCLDKFTNFRDRIQRDDVEVLAMHKRAGKDVGNYAKLWRLFRTRRPDIVHTRNLGTIDAVFPAKLAGVRSVVHGEHGWDVFDERGTNRKYRWLRRACAPMIERQIAVSRHIASWLEDQVRIPRSRVTQIYNGVDTEKFRPAASGRAPLPPAFAPADTYVIGTVGRMAEIKDPVTLARAFRQLCEAGDAPARRARLVMVGDGPMREDVNRALAGAGLGDVTWLPGRRDDIAEILRGLDLFVLPSRNEGISNTILEAMATGLPVLATDVGGNSELVVAGVTGSLVPAENPAAMAAAIRGYLENPDLGRVQGIAARRRAVAEFSIETMVNKYLEIYDSLAASLRGRTR